MARRRIHQAPSAVGILFLIVLAASVAGADGWSVPLSFQSLFAGMFTSQATPYHSSAGAPHQQNAKSPRPCEPRQV